MWNLSSPTRDWTHAHCIARQIPNHWTTREVPTLSFEDGVSASDFPDPLSSITGTLTSQRLEKRTRHFFENEEASSEYTWKAVSVPSRKAGNHTEKKARTIQKFERTISRAWRESNALKSTCVFLARHSLGKRKLSCENLQDTPRHLLLCN